MNQQAIGIVGLDALGLKHRKGDHAGEHQVERAEQFEPTRQEDTLLALCEAAGAECSLDDLLVGCPVKQGEQEHA